MRICNAERNARHKIILALVKSEDKPLSVSEAARRLGLPKSFVLNSFKALAAQNKIGLERAGGFAAYAKAAAMNAVMLE